MIKILLIEDSLDFQVVVGSALKNRCQLTFASSVRAAREELRKGQYDAVLLDVSLPDGSGFEFCAELKGSDEHKDLPILLLTGKKEAADRVMGWNIGADDYIEKPFHPFEFQARVDAQVRRRRARIVQNEVLIRGVFKLDLALHDARITSPAGDRFISLTPNEFKLFHLLIKNQDRVLSRGQLQGAAWGENTFVSERTVDRHISAIRTKLGPEACCIQTVAGFGYRFSIFKSACGQKLP